jgi:hypothetical protein
MATVSPTITSVSASQASAGAQKAAQIYNQEMANRDGTSFGQPAPPPPKPRAAKSLAHGATKLSQDQAEWNEICNLFGWKGTGGKSRKSRRGRNRRGRKKTIRKRGKKTGKRRIRSRSARRTQKN